MTQIKPLRILVISSDWRNIFRTNFDELYKKLERDQLRPDINHFFFFSWSTTSYTDDTQERFRTVHVKTIFRFFRPITDFFSIFIVPWKVYRRFKPDVIFVFDIGLIPAAWVTKKFLGGKLVLCLTNMPRFYSATRRFGRIKYFYSGFFERVFIRLVDIVYTLNAPMKEYVVSLGVPLQRIVIFVSDTLKRDIEHIPKIEKGYIRKTHSIPPEKKIILSIGRLEAEKGYPRLLDYFSKLPDDYYLVIAGTGSLREVFEQQIRRLGITDRVKFVGFVNRDLIWNYYADANVFALLSNVEALGLVFWEAMYMGLPVIGSDAPGIVESVGEDGLRGYIMKKTDGEREFAHKVAQAIHQGSERNGLILRAKKYVEEQIEKSVSINDIA